jgi:GT2 family glycosyltransferase
MTSKRSTPECPGDPEQWVNAPHVSVIIKALNEEKNIERAIVSALGAVGAIGGDGEVILADSLSTDRTVEVASGYPVRVVQLADPAHRSCGAGAQLGMQIARGRFLYVLDGDMELDRDFLPRALAELDRDPGLAGVAGIVEEMHVDNYAFKGRVARAETARARDGAISLDMGGLYRREAIEAVGYLTNPNLHAYEEFELGARLNVAGWRLRRMPVRSVRHYGHTDSSYALLWRRWRSRYAWGHGELLRQAWGRSHFGLVLRHLRVYRLQFAVLAVWVGVLLLLALAGPVTAAVVTAALWVFVFALLAWRKRSAGAAAYALVAWHLGLAGLIRGFFGGVGHLPVTGFPHRVLQ